jgi:hypothetical protein
MQGNCKNYFCFTLRVIFWAEWFCFTLWGFSWLVLLPSLYGRKLRLQNFVLHYGFCFTLTPQQNFVFHQGVEPVRTGSIFHQGVEPILFSTRPIFPPCFTLGVKPPCFTLWGYGVPVPVRVPFGALHGMATYLETYKGQGGHF